MILIILTVITETRAIKGSISYNSDNATFMALMSAANKNMIREYCDVITRLISSPELRAAVISEYHQEEITKMAIPIEKNGE